MRIGMILTAALLVTALGCDRRVDGIDQASTVGAPTRAALVNEAALESAPPDQAETTPSDADNTAVNARDRDGAAPTPFDQGQGQDDINTTATIRKRVIESATSINGQNIKIITNSGKVTLRGPVESDEEKAAIERVASDVAGPDNVTSMLEVDRS
jgi:hyperosmotically inducible periplasmic protein